jgi:hypothetical protein
LAERGRLNHVVDLVLLLGHETGSLLERAGTRSRATNLGRDLATGSARG